MNFAEQLALLPTVDHLRALQLLDDQGQLVAQIDNAPGKAGSLRVYAALAQQFGAITPQAAQLGLQWFAEHTEAARAHPGSHPNIDRLFDLIERGACLQVQMLTNA